jgi:hypothetical protein
MLPSCPDEVSRAIAFLAGRSLAATGTPRLGRDNAESCRAKPRGILVSILGRARFSRLSRQFPHRRNAAIAFRVIFAADRGSGVERSKSWRVSHRALAKPCRQLGAKRADGRPGARQRQASERKCRLGEAGFLWNQNGAAHKTNDPTSPRPSPSHSAWVGEGEIKRRSTDRRYNLVEERSDEQFLPDTAPETVGKPERLECTTNIR